MYTEIKSVIEADTTLSGIVGTRVYQRKPNQEPAQAYITMRVLNRMPNDVRMTIPVRLYVFAPSMDTCVSVIDRLITILHGRNSLGTSTAYKIYIDGSSDGQEKLANGFHYSILDIVVQKTT